LPTTHANLARLLRESIERGHYPVGSRLPTVRQLAAEHHVSTATVQATLRHLRALRLVESRPRQGNFVLGHGLGAPAPTRRAPRRVRRVAILNVPADLSDPHAWHVSIIPAFERALMDAGFEPAKPPGFPGPGSADPAGRALRDWLADAGAMRGALIFADGLTSHALLDALDDRRVPWVTINRYAPPSTHNFVAFDGYGMGRLLGHWFVKEGLERVLWLEPHLGRAAVPMEMKVGIAQGYFEADAPRCPLEVLKLRSADAGSLDRVALEALAAHLRERADSPPQVIVGWMHLLLHAREACAAAGLRVPEQTGLVGMVSGAEDLFAAAGATAVLGDNPRIGRETALMLAHMIREGHRRLAGRYIPGTLHIGTSLRMSESTWRSLNAYAWSGGPRLERPSS
jgi:hypothetical protein